MRTFLALQLLCFFTSQTLSISNPPIWSQLAHDPGHSGRSLFFGPRLASPSTTQVQVSWSLPLGDDIIWPSSSAAINNSTSNGGGAVIDANGNYYVAAAAAADSSVSSVSSTTSTQRGVVMGIAPPVPETDDTEAQQAKVIWRSYIDQAPIISSPSLIEDGKGAWLVIVLTADGSVFSFYSGTGTIAWTYSPSSSLVVSALTKPLAPRSAPATVAADQLSFGVPVIFIGDNTETGVGVMHALRGDSGEIVSNYSTVSSSSSTMRRREGGGQVFTASASYLGLPSGVSLLIPSSDTFLYLLNPSSGYMFWKCQAPFQSAPFDSFPPAIDSAFGNIFAVHNSATAIVAVAGPTGQQLWTTQVIDTTTIVVMKDDEKTESNVNIVGTPAISPDSLLIYTLRSDGKLVAIETSTGDIQWSFDTTSSSVSSSPSSSFASSSSSLSLSSSVSYASVPPTVDAGGYVFVVHYLAQSLHNGTIEKSSTVFLSAIFNNTRMWLADTSCGSAASSPTINIDGTLLLECTDKADGEVGGVAYLVSIAAIENNSGNNRNELSFDILAGAVGGSIFVIVLAAGSLVRLRGSGNRRRLVLESDTNNNNNSSSSSNISTNMNGYSSKGIGGGSSSSSSRGGGGGNGGLSSRMEINPEDWRSNDYLAGLLDEEEQVEQVMLTNDDIESTPSTPIIPKQQLQSSQQRYNQGGLN